MDWCRELLSFSVPHSIDLCLDLFIRDINISRARCDELLDKIFASLHIPSHLLCRRYVMRRDRSGEPTSLLPLRKVRSVTVLVDTAGGEEESGRMLHSAPRCVIHIEGMKHAD